MDADKLNEAAENYSRVVSNAYPYYATSHNLEYECNKAFQNGANWLMQQPLSDRLTDEEKEKIMQVYRHASYPSNRVTFAGQTVLRLFPSIFGKELFNEK